jgi:RHS repeat-associated protein
VAEASSIKKDYDSAAAASSAQSSAFAVSAPSVSLPKGGGAIHGIGEKFAANPMTGTGSMSVPIATSSGRSGFGPQLSLSYDSGVGNGPFGFGWNHPLPSITRKTAKGMPQYHDAKESYTNDSDVFLLSGAEDLVPMLVQNAQGKWERENVPAREVSGKNYRVDRYRPRIEGLFARIERWTNSADASDVFWRSISKDNLTSWYGKTPESRIADPDDPTHARIFSWLICESHDDKGNGIVYGYKRENSARIFEDAAGNSLSKTHEHNRSDSARSAQLYLKRIRYGNRTPYFPVLSSDAPWPQPADANESDGSNAWCFEVVFDYGEHDANAPRPNDAGLWPARSDPFSSYRSGFEVRTYRLCRRVLMFHHFPGETGVERDCLVRSTDFTYSDEIDPQDVRNPVYTFLESVTQTGYRRNNSSYDRRSLPPVEFEYTKPVVQEVVEEVDPESLENLPIGLDGSVYRWTDLHGEGIPGILTEQAGAWFYKRNLSPIPENLPGGRQQVSAKFAPLETVALKPNVGLSSGAEIMDLTGDGRPDVVVMDGPTPGLYEHDDAAGWEPFRPFTSRLNRNLHDPNLKFVDLDGDGHADVLITEDEAFVWHASLAEEGFGPARRVMHSLDEEKSPRIVFADGTQSIYLADLSGDGLTDIVRIRNGEVCYWPNLGYGHFGAKVTMDNAPWFDHPDQFDHQRIRLADIDGSGTTDIIYLHRDGVRLFFNQSGNTWSQPHQLTVFPRVDDVVSIVLTDLLGNGTACLVWSSPLPGDARSQMRYVNLMGNQKPHLLIKTINNMGAETLVQYAPSTKFYLQDKQDGKPWITKLPFPVHVVEKLTITDRWRKTSFSSTCTYHHGYFDGIEREFRGFGRVEQLDTESYGEFASGNSASPYITDDKTLYQPPVKTIIWYHTGAFLDRERILSQFKHEYFPHSFASLSIRNGFEENQLPEPDLDAQSLSAEEWREALRACKGTPLRQEVYELDVDALERPANPKHVPVRLFSTAYHNCHIRCLQPKELNAHAVFLVAESEAITYHYELDLTHADVRPDPRIAHALNLNVDDYGNVLQSAGVVYSRIGKFEDDPILADGMEDHLSLIGRVQREETHLAYTETRYTEDFGHNPLDQQLALDNHRLRLPCESLTYELTGVSPQDTDDQTDNEKRYFSIDELRRFRLSLAHQISGEAVEELSYQELPDTSKPQKRRVEHVRTLFFADNLVIPLPFGEHGLRGLPYENYKLALTESLLDAVFADTTGTNKLDQTIDGATTARAKLNEPAISGYLSGADLIARFASQPAADLAGQYWIRSGIAGFAADAAQHFYLPERYTDPFGNVTSLEYDARHLFVASSTDAMANNTRVTQFDYHVLAPREMQDINNNLSEVFFDVLGLPTAMAVRGKGDEGDNLLGFDGDPINLNRVQPSLADLRSFFGGANLDEARARIWLNKATARHVYDFGGIEQIRPDGTTVLQWVQHPPCICGIVREQHVSQLGPGAQSPIQAAFEYSDGIGSVIVKKAQAEPEVAGGPLRWVASGKTILNNKGKPVKQYEPYFSSPEVGHGYEEPVEVGVTAVIYYDAVGRVMRTEMPDGSYTRVEFSPWHVRSYDQNDTAFDIDPAKRSDWYRRRTDPTHPRFAEFANPENVRAAKLTEAHADTPGLTILDSLGREVISVAHNRVEKTGDAFEDEKYLVFTKLDAEGKPLWIRDARKNLVMQYVAPPAANNQTNDPAAYAPCYDIAGNLLFQHSMDSGDRWMLNDAAGKPMFAWDSRGHAFRTEYDPLHRPTGSFVRGADPLDANRIIQFEKMIYGDMLGNGLSDSISNDETRKLNLRGKLYQHFDSAGLVVSKGRNPVRNADEAFDFKGNPLRSTRQLISDYKSAPDWSQSPALETEIFGSSTRYDALNRPIQLVAPHSDQAAAKFNITRPSYNEANLLERVDVWLEQSAEPSALLAPATANLNAVANIDYDAKGQRLLIEYNEASHRIVTRYSYDKETFRLTGLVSTRPLHTEAGKRTLQNLSYTYDPVGNITDIHDDAQQAVFFNNSIIEPSNAYAYDALYRLIRAEGREHAAQNNFQRDAKTFEPIISLPFPNSPEALQRYSEDYEYDAVGNILGLIHTGGAVQRWNRRYQYALDSNRLLATRVPSDPSNLPNYTDTPGCSAKYSYDPHGSMISMPHLPVMEWDFKDQLHASQQRVVNDGGAAEKTWYVYDASGQRVRKTTETQNGTPEDERIYLGGFEVYRKYSGNGETVTLERETLHVMDDKQRIALIETRTHFVGDDPAPRQLVRFQLGNHLGSAALELDDQALMISSEEYHPYGSTAYQSSRNQTETSKRYRYTGKERDEETGFSYHGARYCAPWLGKWVSCDPAGLVDGPNLYAYVHDSPVRYSDPTGQIGRDAQLWLDQQLTQDVRATRTTRGFDRTLSQDMARASDAFGPGGATHAGHDKPFVITRDGEIGTTRPQPGGENSKLGATQDKQVGQAARAKGEFARDTKGAAPPVSKSAKPPRPAKAPWRKALGEWPGSVPVQKPPTQAPISPKPISPAPSTQLELRPIQPAGSSAGAQATPATPSPTNPAAAPAAPQSTPAAMEAPLPIQPASAAPGRAARATAWTLEVAPKALKILGQVVTVLGAGTEGDKTAKLVREQGGGEFTQFTNFSAVFILGVAAGAVDDAFAIAESSVAGAPVMTLDSWQQHNAGPFQHAVGEAYRAILKW